MAPAWLWLQIFLSDPARAHLSPARLGRGLTPGSMKACVVHSSRIQTPHSTSPSILYNPNPFTACLLNEVTLGSPPYGVPSSGQCLQHLLPFHIHRDPSQDPREKAGNNSGGLTGKGRVMLSSRQIPASQCCLCICRSIPNPSPREGFAYCKLFALLLFNSSAQEARSLHRLVNEYRRHRPLRLPPGAAGRPYPSNPGPGQASRSPVRGHPAL